jgi:hypothetical protein
MAGTGRPLPMDGRNVPNGGHFRARIASGLADLGTYVLTDEPVCVVARDAHQYR